VFLPACSTAKAEDPRICELISFHFTRPTFYKPEGEAPFGKNWRTKLRDTFQFKLWGASRIKFWCFHVTRSTLQKPEGGAPSALFVIVANGN
jgi:hypothetical protein